MIKDILFVSGNLYPHKIGGYEVFNYYLFDKLSKAYNIKIVNSFEHDKLYAKTQYHKISNYPPSGLFEPLQYFFYLLFRKRIKNTVVILTYSRSRWLQWWPYPILNKLVGLKYIVIIHGGGLYKWDWGFIHKLFLLNAKEVIGISKRICEEYKFRTKKDITYLPPIIPFNKYDGGKSEARIPFNIGNSDIVFLYVGSLKPLKNPQTLIDAATLLGKEYISNKKLKFVFAGDGFLREKLEGLVNKNNLREHFIFLGNVKREDVPVLYALSDFYIMCSDFEGTPISLLEAMFNSLVVFASDAPGINTIINNGFNGFLYIPRSAGDLAEKMKVVLQKKDIEKQRIGQNAKIYFEDNYSFEKTIEQLISIISKL